MVISALEANLTEATTTATPAAKRARSTGVVDDPLWYKDAIIYELRTRSFYDSNGDGIGDLGGLAAKLDYIKDLGVTAIWLLPLCPSPGKDDGYDIADYMDVHPDVGTLADLRHVISEARRRGIRVITELVIEPHVGPAPVVPARAPRAARQPGARLLRLERHARALPRGAHHLQGLRALQLDVGSRGERVLLASLLRPPARSQLREPGRARGDVRGRRLLVRPRDRRPPARRGALPLRGRGDQLREPPEDPRLSQEAAGAHRREVEKPDAPRRGQPVAGGRGGLLRRRRRVPHELPLPDHAADVHGDSDGGPVSDHRHPRGRRRPFPPGASGRCSCATTTS